MGTVTLQVEKTDVNVIDAIGRGTGEGLHLALNVGAMLISFLALVALVNAALGLAGLSLQQILGWLFAPIAWGLGVPWRDAPMIGNLLGTRMVLNEFVAYSQLGPLKSTLDPRSFTIATFALCGFANFSSIGIQIGGIGALAPERRHDLARLGLRAMLAGTFANFITATIAGMLLCRSARAPSSRWKRPPSRFACAGERRPRPPSCSGPVWATSRTTCSTQSSRRTPGSLTGRRHRWWVTRGGSWRAAWQASASPRFPVASISTRATAWRRSSSRRA
jgi:hypothetical protein